MFYNIYRDIRPSYKNVHFMIYVNYSKKEYAIYDGKVSERGTYNGMLQYVKTIEFPGSDQEFFVASLYGTKDETLNRIFPEINFYHSGHAQYK